MSAPPVRVLGLRHLALRVRDVRAAREFYVGVFGMRVVWEPDAQNVYLTSGCDNLALHEDAAVALRWARPSLVGGAMRRRVGKMRRLRFLPGNGRKPVTPS